MKIKINTSLACWVGYTHEQGMKSAKNEQSEGLLTEPLWGALHLDHVQIVPQARGLLTEDIALNLRNTYPDTEFRLHANVRVKQERCIYDISNYPEAKDWFKQAARLQHLIGGKVYSAHTGFRRDCDLDTMFGYAQELSDLFGQPVAIEGQYPDKHDSYLLSYWPEYQALLESGLPFALDLSHLNIVARQSLERNLTLTKELLASENCLEVHVSHNNGTGDWHQVCEQGRRPWWYNALIESGTQAVIFTEGNRRAREIKPQTSRP